jgi:hypothetical protein
MRSPLVRILLIIGALLIVALVALLIVATCGDGDDEGNGGNGASEDGESNGEEEPAAGSLNLFMEELEPVAQAFAAERADLEALDFSDQPDDARARNGDDVFEQAGEAVDEYVRGVARLEPSSHVQEFQDDTVSTGQQLVLDLETAQEEAENATEPDAIDAAYSDLLGAGSPYEELVTLCADAQTIADDNDLGVDLEC